MTCKRQDCCREDMLTARFRELNEAAERRKKQEANVTLSLRTAAELPCKRRGVPCRNPGRDAVEAFQAVCQVVWYGIATAFSLAFGMAWRMILKGLGKTRSK